MNTEIIRHLEDQLSAAMQLIAALTLTDEMCLAYPDGPSKKAWADEMRKELQLPGFQRDLAAVLKGHHWLQNTHPGFALSALEFPVTRRMDLSLTKVKLMSLEYARGEVPPVSDFKSTVVEAIKDDPSHAMLMRYWGEAIVAEAVCKRIVLDSKHG